MAYVFSYRYMLIHITHCPRICEVISLIVLILIITAFAFFTFYPPQIGLFKEPAI